LLKKYPRLTLLLLAEKKTRERRERDFLLFFFGIPLFSHSFS
jgi:hypothetical protein